MNIRWPISNYLERCAWRIRPQPKHLGDERDWNVTADINPGVNMEDAIEELMRSMTPGVGGSMMPETVNARFTTTGLRNLRIEETTDA